VCFSVLSRVNPFSEFWTNSYIRLLYPHEGHPMTQEDIVIQSPARDAAVTVVSVESPSFCRILMRSLDLLSQNRD
jgi:hypothetical protein